MSKAFFSPIVDDRSPIVDDRSPIVDYQSPIVAPILNYIILSVRLCLGNRSVKRVDTRLQYYSDRLQ